MGGESRRCETKVTELFMLTGKGANRAEMDWMVQRGMKNILMKWHSRGAARDYGNRPGKAGP